MKPALLVIDMQIRFYNSNNTTKESYDSAIEYINAAIDLFRERDLPVISVLHQDKESGLVPEAADFEMHEDIKLLPSDIRIIKEYGNSFNKTPLLGKLKEQGVDTVILTGFCAEHCVLSTCRGTEDVDLVPILLRGSLASGTPKNIKFVERTNDMISFGALEAFLKLIN